MGERSMQLEEALISGVSVIVGALIAASSSFLISRRDQKWKQAKKDIIYLCQQAKSLYELEAIYIDNLQKVLPNGKAHSIKIKFRKLLSENSALERIVITPKELESIKKRWS